MGEITYRPPRDDDWPAILKLAELSLAEMPIAPSQHEWQRNRRSFTRAEGFQEHFVATQDERIVGYACVERRISAVDGGYRLFVVVEPPARASLGTVLLAKLRDRLIGLGARYAWFVEYEADTRFLSYLEAMGFVRVRSFRLDDGSPVVRLKMDAPFQSLAQRT